LPGTAAVHHPGTEKFSVEAEWCEPLDQGMMKEKHEDCLYVVGHESVFEQYVTPPKE
jgi:hypothetical protein